MNDTYDINDPDILYGIKNSVLTTQLVGHIKAWDTFIKCKENKKIHHAWILSGPKGVGKATFCWKIAENLLTKNKLSADERYTKKASNILAHKVFLCQRPYDTKLKRVKKVITIDEIRRMKSFFNIWN